MAKTSLLIDEKKYRPLSALLRGYAEVDEKGMTDIAQLLGFKDWRTAKRYLRNPEKLTVKDLARLGRNFGIPINDLREAAIKY